MTGTLTRPTRDSGTVARHSAFEPRLVERLIAAVALVGCAPVLAGAAVAIRILSRRSPLVAHKRVGLDNIEFRMLKLRTMWDRADDAPTDNALLEYLPEGMVPARKKEGDRRVTSRFAMFLRRYSIDEWPQFLHVLTGTMALVGPRPLTRAEHDDYYSEVSSEVLTVRPGMTGLWQVLGRDRLTYAQRRRLDLFYVRRRCIGLWLLIVLRTPIQLFTGRDAS
jgi:exopolysaccharide production protein ExoY